MKVDLPEGVSLAATNWTVCFGSRGISNDNVSITLEHGEFGAIQVEVLVGGTTRVL
jgi:hypothetical protein